MGTPANPGGITPTSPGEVGKEVTQPPTVHDCKLTVRRRLRGFLRFVAVVTWLAFVAAFMPEKWFVEISEFLLGSSFPQTSLGFYLARHLSLIYGFVGVLLWIMAGDLDRYLPLTRKMSKMTIAFGGLQLMVDFASNMPLWWTFSESLSTIFGGIVMLWLAKQAE